MNEAPQTQGPQLFIDKLQLQLPGGYERRAAAIARETVRQLGKLSIDCNLRLDTLQVPRLRLQGGETDGLIARRIARAIHGQLTAQANAQGGRHA